MSKIDEIKKQIEELQKQLATEESKINEDNYLKFKDTEIDFVVYNYSTGDETHFWSFSKLCDYVFKHLGKRDIIFLDCVNNNKPMYYEYRSDSDINRKELFNVLFQLNAMQLSFIDFGIADKNDKIKQCIYIKSPDFFDEYIDMINNNLHYDKNYREMMHNKAKSWYIWR